ncbi:MAG TPA: ABC transporter ATP-binding protein [Acidimicrobiales bacterium]
MTGDRAGVSWQDVSVTLGDDVRVLESVTLAVDAGEVLGVVGPNGAGKSTLFRATCGLVAYTGEIDVAGERVRPGHPPAGVAALVEQPAFYPWASGRQNLDLLAACRGIGREAVEDALRDADLWDVRDRRVRAYSQGMRQRLGLASVFLSGAQVVLLDEPATALDPPAVQWLRDTVAALRDAGRAVLIASHVLTAVEREADHVAVLARGALVLHEHVDALAERGGLERVFLQVVGGGTAL